MLLLMQTELIYSTCGWNPIVIEKCEILVERKLEKKNPPSKGWEAFQGKVLAQKYDEAKWNKIRESRKASGLWYQAEDFPDDDLDSLFLLRRRNFSFSNPQEFI